jgi:hypothetical protein
MTFASEAEVQWHLNSEQSRAGQLQRARLNMSALQERLVLDVYKAAERLRIV